MDKVECLVIGAGVIGLAVARRLAQAGREVIVLEAAEGIGTVTSSRNSEVIHAGIYYPTGSLRARHATRGRRMLYDFCASHNVAHNKCGKLIVATDAAEQAKVETLLAQGHKNGVEGLELIGGNAARALESNLSCIGALSSPESGIIDSHGYMLALWGELEDRGGRIAFETPVERMSFVAPHWQVEFGGSDVGTVVFDAVIISAGLGAQKLARRIDRYPPDKIPPLVLAKGNYFAFAGKPVFSRLIYPTPVDGGLGVHVTLDMAGRMRFGPDVEWIENEDYAVDPHRADAFYDRIHAYWPGLPDGSLVPDYCGIRPKLSGPGQPAADFLIAGEAAHGLPRLVCLFGIESPGLTASLSLAEDVIDALTA
jgi:L-2-hydroxyglutarate oxidase LhgO